MKFDIHNELEYKLHLIATLSGVTPGAPTTLDRAGFEAVDFIVSTGTITDAGTAAGIVWELQESDDDSTYTAVSDTDLLGTEVALSILLDTKDSVYIGKLGYVGAKRYLKLIPTGSTGTDGQVIVHAVCGRKRVSPTS